MTNNLVKRLADAQHAGNDEAARLAYLELQNEGRSQDEIFELVDEHNSRDKLHNAYLKALVSGEWDNHKGKNDYFELLLDDGFDTDGFCCDNQRATNEELVRLSYVEHKQGKRQC